MKRVALIVGIDHYDHVSGLYGCVNDAYNVANILKRNGDGTKNFECGKIMTASNSSSSISKSKLKDSLKNLFSIEDAYIALFYFAGHGHIESTGGYLVASDARRGDDGLALNEIIKLAKASTAINKIIILDSCHSGIAGASTFDNELSILPTGMTILTASTAEQYATEKNGGGVFTSLMVDALSGGAANLLGQVTPGSVYAHIDQSLGDWDLQRPVFKTNIKSFVSLRSVAPPISLEDLQSIIQYFPSSSFEYQLDPTYEKELIGRTPEMPLPIEEHTRIFERLQKFNKLNLLVPVNAPHMWHAAMESKSCKLTALGEHYRNLVENDRI